MIVKAVLLFLIAIAVLGMFGRLRAPRLPGRKRGTPVRPARKCRQCGAYVIGSGPCRCGAPGPDDPR